MTECHETLFPFEVHFSRRVVAQFTGDCLTTDGGSLLLRQAERKIGLLRRVAACFTDCQGGDISFSALLPIGAGAWFASVSQIASVGPF
jgi:hypothetical protein